MVSWVKDGSRMCLGRLLADLVFMRGQSASPWILVVPGAANRLSRGERAVASGGGRTAAWGIVGSLERRKRKRTGKEREESRGRGREERRKDGRRKR